VPSETIPSGVGDLTPEWLTGVLSPHAPGARVTTVEVTDSHSGTTGRVVLRLGYEGDRGILPDSVFCKIEPFDERQRRLLRQFGIGAVEARFYAELAADVGVRVPLAWHAEFGEDGSFVMVLEDLGGSGCRFRRGTDAPPAESAERAMATVEALAALHARFWESRRFANDLSWVPERAGFGAGGGHDPTVIAASAHFAQKALDAFADDMPPAFGAVGALYRDRVGDILDLWDEGPRTLVHGDPHEGNLFDDGDRAGFYDWAMFSHSPGVRDIAYHCATSLPVDVRREIEVDLLARYRAGLAAGGVELSVDDIDRQYRVFAVFAWVSMASTAAMGSRWQPADYAMRSMERATAAVADLGSVDVLEDLL
jgi:hypothetical protein